MHRVQFPNFTHWRSAPTDRTTAAAIHNIDGTNSLRRRPSPSSHRYLMNRLFRKSHQMPVQMDILF